MEARVITRTNRSFKAKVRFASAAIALAGAVGAVSGLALATPAGATTQFCNASGSPLTCSVPVTGTLTLTGGNLTLTAPSTFTWSAALTGSLQYAVDGTNTTYTVNDATGSGNGWNVTAAATVFVCSGGCAGAGNLVLTTNGSTTSQSASTPLVTCTAGTGTKCTGSTEPTYPVALTTSAQTILEAAAGAGGMGSNVVSPVGWWVTIPAATYAGIYTTTVTLAVNSGP